MLDTVLKHWELHKILERLAEQTAFSAGRELALPSVQATEVCLHQQATAEAKLLLSVQPSLSVASAHDIRPLVKRAEIGATLDAQALLDIQSALLSGKMLRRAIVSQASRFPTLAATTQHIEECPKLAAEIARCICDRGEAMDRRMFVKSSLTERTVLTLWQRLRVPMKDRQIEDVAGWCARGRWRWAGSRGCRERGLWSSRWRRAWRGDERGRRRPGGCGFWSSCWCGGWRDDGRGRRRPSGRGCGALRQASQSLLQVQPAPAQVGIGPRVGVGVDVVCLGFQPVLDLRVAKVRPPAPEQRRCTGNMWGGHGRATFVKVQVGLQPGADDTVPWGGDVHLRTMVGESGTPVAAVR